VTVVPAAGLEAARRTGLETEGREESHEDPMTPAGLCRVKAQSSDLAAQTDRSETAADLWLLARPNAYARLEQASKVRSSDHPTR